MSNEFNPDGEHRQPPTYAESHVKRMVRHMNACLDASFGTIWWVRENITKNRLPGYDQNSTRKEHPYVSMRVLPALEFVPMLYGSSGKQGPVVAYGLTKERGSLYPTSFGQVVLPLLFSADEIVYRRGIYENEHKPRFNDTEMAALKAWMHIHAQRRK